MNIAVCDDDINVRNQLADLIRKQYADVKISFFKGSEDLISCEDFFNIYFLDIEMGDVSGIELAKRIRERQEDHESIRESQGGVGKKYPRRTCRFRELYPHKTVKLREPKHNYIRYSLQRVYGRSLRCKCLSLSCEAD